MGTAFSCGSGNAGYIFSRHLVAFPKVQCFIVRTSDNYHKNLVFINQEDLKSNWIEYVNIGFKYFLNLFK